MITNSQATTLRFTATRGGATIDQDLGDLALDDFVITTVCPGKCLIMDLDISRTLDDQMLPQ